MVILCMKNFIKVLAYKYSIYSYNHQKQWSYLQNLSGKIDKDVCGQLHCQSQNGAKQQEAA